MPRQLDRIRWYNEYKNHPLRKEYEAKLAEIKKNNGKDFKYYILLTLMVIVWIPIIGLIIYTIIEMSYFYFSDWMLTAFFGILLLIGTVALSTKLSDVKYDVQQKNNRNEFEKLKEFYDSKGLFVFTYDDLIRKCLDEDDNGDPICGVTGSYIGYGQKYYFCKTPRNCLKCKTFMKAYLGNDWDGEYEME